MRPVAVFRFSSSEGPAHFSEWLDREGIPWQLIAIDEGVEIPADPNRFSGIGMMGGPMSVNDPLPWVAPMGSLIRDAISDSVPLLGHCLGGQLMAKALGATVSKASIPEIGWLHVDVCDPGARDEWFGGLPRFAAFQWHHDAFELPPMATRVLTNSFNVNQAYVIDGRHVGFQCHIEMTRDLVDTWCRLGADELPARSNAHLQSEADIKSDLTARLAALNAVADGIYARWARGLKG